MIRVEELALDPISTEMGLLTISSFEPVKAGSQSLSKLPLPLRKTKIPFPIFSPHSINENTNLSF